MFQIINPGVRQKGFQYKGKKVISNPGTGHRLYCHAILQMPDGHGHHECLVENLQIAFSNCTKIEKRLFTSGGLEFHNNEASRRIFV